MFFVVVEGLLIMLILIFLFTFSAAIQRDTIVRQHEVPEGLWGHGRRHGHDGQVSRGSSHSPPLHLNS